MRRSFAWAVIASAIAHNSALATDAQQLSVIQATLESYLSRIESYHIRYECRYVDDEPKLELGDEALGAHYRREVFVRYPSHWRIFEDLAQPDIDNSVFRTYVHNGRFTQIAPNNQTAQQRASTKSDWNYFTPVDAVGYRVIGTRNLRLSECLADHAYILFEGAEEVNGLPTIRLKVGPGLPRASRPDGFGGAEFWMRLWLAPSYEYLPVRWSMHNGNMKIKWFDTSDFIPTLDVSRNIKVPFPRLVDQKSEYAGVVRVNRWIVQDVVFNPPTNSETFNPTIPDGFMLNVDGKVVRSLTLVGGEDARKERLDEIAKDAQAILSTKVAPDDMRASPKWGTITFVFTSVVFAALVCVTAGIIWRKRQG